MKIKTKHRPAVKCVPPIPLNCYYFSNTLFPSDWGICPILARVWKCLRCSSIIRCLMFGVDFRWTAQKERINIETWPVVSYYCYLHIRPRCARTTGAIFVLDVRSTVFKFPAPFSDKLHSRYVIVLPLYQITLNFDGGNLFRPQNRITLRTSSRDQVSSVALAHQLVSWIACDWLTLAQSVARYSYCECYILPINKVRDARVTCQGTLFIEYDSQWRLFEIS